jgi:hypothetical protein
VLSYDLKRFLHSKERAYGAIPFVVVTRLRSGYFLIRNINNRNIISGVIYMTENANVNADTVAAAAAGGAAGATAAANSTISRDDVENMNRAVTSTDNTIDVGEAEAQKRAVVADGHNWEANRKRTYDEYQDLSLSDARQKQEYASRSRDHYDMMMGDNRSYVNSLRKIELELLQNGNTAAKIGDNRMWTSDTEALEATVSAVIAKILDTKDETTSS